MGRTNPAEPVRLLAQGTRVVLIARAAAPAGVVTRVRTEPHLKTYVVLCDDGVTAFASGHELALEGDPARAPLSPAPIY